MQFCSCYQLHFFPFHVFALELTSHFKWSSYNIAPYLCLTGLPVVIFLVLPMVVGSSCGLWLVNVGRTSTDCPDEGCSLVWSDSDFGASDHGLESPPAVWLPGISVTPRSETSGPSLKIMVDEWIVRLVCDDAAEASMIVVPPSSRYGAASWVCSAANPRCGSIRACLCLGASKSINSPDDASSLFGSEWPKDSAPALMLHLPFLSALAANSLSPFSPCAVAIPCSFLSLQISHGCVAKTERFSWDCAGGVLFLTEVESSGLSRHPPLGSELQRTGIKMKSFHWNSPDLTRLSLVSCKKIQQNERNEFLHLIFSPKSLQTVHSLHVTRDWTN